MATQRRQTSPSLNNDIPLDPTTNSSSNTIDPDLNSNSSNNFNSNKNDSPLQPLSPSPSPTATPTATPTLDPLNSNQTPAPLTPLSSPSPTPSSSPSNANNLGSSDHNTTPTLSKSNPTPTNSPASPSPLINSNSTNVTPIPTLNNDTTTTTSAYSASPTRAPTNDPSNAPVLNNVNNHSTAPFRNVPTAAPSNSGDNSSGLSGGAVTGIAVVAGIIGFILLFWVGVQLLQSKKRRREEAEMQEIDFYPSGGSSVNGGMAFSPTTANLDRQPSASNSFNYNSKSAPTQFTDPSHHTEPIHDDSEYAQPHTQPDLDSGLQRQATLGGSSAYSAGYYNNPVPAQPAAYNNNYTSYSRQFGMPPGQPMYEQHPYEYPHGHVKPGEYLHSHAQGYPPTHIDYQR